MDTIKISDRKNCKIIAHRGLSSLERENTVPAFIAAGNRSYFGIETDVHVTSDGKFIIFHDNKTERVAPGINVVVDDTSFDELRKISLSDKYGKGGRPDHRMPTLEEYISVCQHYEKICVLELKNKMDPEAIERMVEEIKETGYLESVIFISFSIDNLVCLRKILPDQKIQFLSGDPISNELFDIMKQNKLDADVYHGILNSKEDVDFFHNSGMEVNVWTVDNAERAQSLINWGIDYLTTNALE